MKNQALETVNVFLISQVKPLQRFTRETWKFHVFRMLKIENGTYHYISELNGQKYETTNIDMQVTVLR